MNNACAEYCVLLCMVFKCLYHSDLVPSIYSNCFVLNNEIHNYNTGLSQAYIFVVQEHLLAKNVFSLKAAHFKGSSLWNRLPSSLKIT